ncbi:50S ribosomal protein L4, partial [bacterium]|nr:50S ribosomal protein L4 [bacterium]
DLLKAFEVQGRNLLIDVDIKDTAFLTIRNINKTELKTINECSPLDIFESDNLFITKAAAELFQQRYAKKEVSHAA